MINKEVIPAFDMLLEELERIIPYLNDQGKKLMDQKKYYEAHDIINKAQSVVEFQKKVVSLRDEWVSMDVPSSRKAPTVFDDNISTVVQLKKIEDGKRTSEEEFKIPILKALVDLGGSATKGNVIDVLEVSMSAQLNSYDWETLSPPNNEIRWKNTAAWARQELVYEGLLAKNSPYGIWEITPAGRNYLQLHKSQKPEIPVLASVQTTRSIKKSNLNNSTSSTYNLSYHLKGKSENNIKIFNQLRGKIMSLSGDISEQVNKTYITYKKNEKTFVEIYLQNKVIKCWVFVPLRKIPHNQSMCRDVSRIGHYGTGPTEITIGNRTEAEYALEIILQSLEWVTYNK